MLEASAALCATPIATSRDTPERRELSPLNARRRHEHSCARDALPHTFNIGEFKSVRNNSTTIKHI